MMFVKKRIFFGKMRMVILRRRCYNALQKRNLLFQYRSGEEMNMCVILQVMNTVKEKYVKLLYENYYASDIQNAFPEPVMTESGDCCYPDIDYTGYTHYNWTPAAHYTRIEAALIRYGRQRLQDDSDWRDRLVGAVKFWVSHDFKCPNWWYNQIDVPRHLLNIALMLGDWLPEPVKAGVEKLVLRGSYKERLYYGITFPTDLPPELLSKASAYDWDGTNLIWSAHITILHALWTKDEMLLRFAAERLSAEIKFAKAGVQPDGAFCQHGVRWYSGIYGKQYVLDCAALIYILADTAFALPDAKTDVLLVHVLDGLRSMMKNGYLDFNALGRMYAEQGRVDSGDLVQGVKLLSQVPDIARKKELEAFCQELKEHRDAYESTKFYKSICQLCHKKNGIYIGVRGRTQGVRGGEGYPSIGFLGYNTSYGTLTCFMESGLEYYDIAPFWDYSKFPGTTAREETDAQLQMHGDWTMERQTDCVAFGTAEQDSGILAERAVHDGIKVTAAYFVFDGVLVALGTDISDDTPEKGRLFTTVEQCLAAEAVIMQDFVKRGDVCYKNLGETGFIAALEVKEGSWQRNYADASDAVLKERLLTITVPMETGHSYAYMIYSKNEPNVEILRNDKACQAILIDKKTVMAVFYSEDKLIAGGRTITGHEGELMIKKIL